MPYTLASVKSLKSICKKFKASHVCIVTSTELFKKIGWAIKEIDFPSENIITISDGETAKNWEEIDKLIKKFIHHYLDRSSIVIALGGGTVGDAVGFACSIYLRGIKYIQVPTTLLAQVDSAHGGKTGINFLDYKNQVGTFYLPLTTIIDTRFIKTLSKEQIVDGLGEIIKAGIIKDPTILSNLRGETVDALPKSTKLKLIIKKAIRVKEYYIKKDFKDTRARQILNFGHTIGHAIELKNNISHGRAVIDGMIKELQIAEKLGLTPSSVRCNLLRVLEKLGIESNINTGIDLESIMHDKKIIGDKIYLPIILSEGRARLVDLDINKIRKLL